MGWFFEDKTDLFPTGKIIAEERVVGSGWTELGKFFAIIAAVWLIGSAHSAPEQQQKAPSPAVTQQAPGPPRGR